MGTVLKACMPGYAVGTGLLLRSLSAESASHCSTRRRVERKQIYAFWHHRVAALQSNLRCVLTLSALKTHQNLVT